MSRKGKTMNATVNGRTGLIRELCLRREVCGVTSAGDTLFTYDVEFQAKDGAIIKYNRIPETKIEVVHDVIGPEVTPSDETIERCLRILEFWQNNNKKRFIQGELKADGTTKYTIQNR